MKVILSDDLMTPIKDDTLTGHGQTAGLVNARGGIEWLSMRKLGRLI